MPMLAPLNLSVQFKSHKTNLPVVCFNTTSSYMSSSTKQLFKHYSQSNCKDIPNYMLVHGTWLNLTALTAMHWINVRKSIEYHLSLL